MTAVARRSRSDALRWRAAYHEGGHAVAAYRWGFTLTSISVADDGTGNSSTAGWMPVELALSMARACRAAGGALWRWWAANAEAEVEVCLAGPLSEERYVGRELPPGVGDVDVGRAEALARARWGAEAERHFWRAADTVVDTLATPEVWRAVERIAEALVERGVLDRHEAGRLLGATGLRQRTRPPCPLPFDDLCALLRRRHGWQRPA